MASYIFLGLIGLVRLIVAVNLLRMASRRKLPNLNWLAWGFLTTVIAIPFTATPYLPFVDQAIAYITYLCYAIFIARTFYQGRRNPLAPFWIAFTLLYGVLFWLTGNFMAEVTGIGFPQNFFSSRPPKVSAAGGVAMTRFEMFDAALYGCLQMSVWLWHAIAAYQAHQVIAGDRYVGDWIKSRYHLMIAYSCLQSLVGVAMIIRPFIPAGMATLIVAFLALLVFCTTIMQYLVWIMPIWFYKWLNRNYQDPLGPGASIVSS